MLRARQTVDWMKQEYPHLSNRSDHDVYEMAKRKWAGADWEESPFVQSIADTAIITDKKMSEINSSPEEFKKIDSFANLSDSYAKSGIPWLGLSPEAFQTSANQSISGLLYQMKEGKLKYNVEDYDPSIWENVASFFIGLANPIDALAFVGSGGVGGVVSKGILRNALSKKFVQNAVAGSFRNKLANNVGTHAMSEAVLSGAIGLGSYSAATGAIAETAKQATEIKNPEYAKQLYGPEVFQDGSKNPDPYVERDKYDIGDIFIKGVAHGAEGALLGGVTAGTGKFIGNKFLAVQRDATGSFAKNAAKILNYPTQIGVEAAEFTTIPYLFHGGPKNAEQFYDEFFHSVGIIGVFKANRALFSSANADIKANMASARELLEAKKNYLNQNEKSLKNVKNDIESQIETGKKNTYDKQGLANIDAEIGKETKTISELIKTYEDIDRALSKTELHISKDKLTIAETKEMFENGTLGIDLLDGWLLHMKELKETNPTLHEQLSKGGQIKIKEDIIKQLSDVRDKLNDKAVASEKNQPFIKKKVKEMDDVEITSELGRLDGIIKNKIGKPEAITAAKDLVKLLNDAKNEGRLSEANVEKFIKDRSMESPEFKSAVKAFEVEREAGRKRALIDEAIKEGVPHYTKDSIQKMHDTLKKADKPSENKQYSFALEDYDLNNPRDRVAVTKQIIKAREQMKIDKSPGEFRLSQELRKLTEEIGELKEQQAEVPGTDRMRVTELIEKEADRRKVLEAPETRIEKKAKELAELIGVKDYDNLLSVSTVNFFEKYLSDKGLNEKGQLKGLANANALRRFFEWGNKTGKIKNFRDLNRNNIKEYFETFIREDKIDMQTPSVFNAFIDYLAANRFISNDTANNLKIPVSHYHSIANELNVAREPAKEGVRQGTLQIIVDLANKGDYESAYAGFLGVEYGLRIGEIPKLRSKHIQLSEQGDWFLNIGSDVKKSRTFNRVVYLETDFAVGLQDFLKAVEGEKGFTGLKTTAISREMKKRGLTLNTGPKAQPFFDLRKRTTTIGAKTMPEELYRQMFFMHGHGNREALGLGRIERSYNISNVNDALAFQKRMRQYIAIPGLIEMQKDVSPIGRFKFQLQPLGEASLDASFNKLVKRFQESNPGLKVVFEKDKAYAGKFLKDVIYLTQGKANLQTFFHENGHRFEAFIRDIGDKEMIKLWERGEKMFSNEAKKSGQTANEFFTDRVSDYGVGMSIGIRNKMVGWSKLMMTKIKKFFFGKENLNKRDISRLLGEKVYKGFGTENSIKLGERPKFQVVSTPRFAKQIRETFDILSKNAIKGSDKMDSLTLKGKKNELITFIAKQAGIENYDNFKISSSMGSEKLQLFYTKMALINISQYSQTKDLVDFLGLKETVDKARQSYNINLDNQEKILKHIGVKSGLIKDSSTQQLKEYMSFIDRSGFVKTEKAKDWIQESIDYNLLSNKQANEFMKISEKTAWALPVQSVLKRIGLGKLADKLYDHQVQEMRHVTRSTTMENNIAAILQTKGRIKNEAELGVVNLARGQSKFRKIQDFLWLFDKERRLEAIEEGLLSSKEKKFVAQSFEKNGKGDIIKGSIAEMIQKEITDFNIYFKEQLEISVKRNMNDAEFEQWKKDNNVQWIEEGVYVHRGLTKEFFEIYRPDSQALERFVHKEGRRLAAKMAKKKNPGATTQELKIEADKILLEAQEMVRSQMQDMFNFSSGRLRSQFLQKRNEKLPERWFSEAKGKEIKVYETSYDKTFKKYAIGMGKYISNVEFFPEHVNLKGLTTPGTKAQIQKLRGYSKKWANYTEEILSRQLGIGRNVSIFEESHRKLNTYAQFLAKTQLAFPTAGLKNLLVGQYQNLYAFNLRQMATALSGVFSREKRAEIRRLGATEIGLKHIDNYQGYFKGALETGFRFGLMKPTENINRYISVLAGRADQTGLVNVIKSYKSGRKYEKSMKRLKDFYRLSDVDIKLLKKYGLAGTDGIAMNVIDRKMTIRKLNQVYRKMDASAHIYTQGATVDLFMPFWMGVKGFKPLTLYKRMAYAATTNTFNNLKAAFTQGDIMKIAVGSLGAVATGEMLMGVYDLLLGQDKPNQNSGKWDRLMMALWKGEFSGVLSDFWNPGGDSKFDHTLSPAVYNHAKDMIVTMVDFGQGEIDAKGSIKEMLRKTSSSYNAYIKITEKKQNPYNRGVSKYGMKWNEYEKEFNPTMNRRELEHKRNTYTPIYKNLRTIFNLGTNDDLVKEYIRAVVRMAHDNYRKGQNVAGKPINTVEEAFKEAERRVNNYMRELNPNKGSFINWERKEEKTLKKYGTYLNDFLTKEEKAELLKLEGQYIYKYRQYFNVKTGKIKPEILAKYKLKPFASEFDWK